MTTSGHAPIDAPAPDRRTDAGLVALIAHGHRDAFAELYDRYGKIAFGLAFRVTRDHQLAEEVVQEAFLGVWRQAARFDATRAKPSTWLLTIVHHRSVDVVRREQRRRTEPADELGDVADTTNVPHEAWLGIQS
ncbi:MAG: sigma-70 family RNA polymerase sigma factor, partial [Gaiellales bacterium]